MENKTEYTRLVKRSTAKRLTDEGIYRDMVIKVIKGLRYDSLKEMFKLTKLDIRSKEFKELIEDVKVSDDTKAKLENMKENNLVEYSLEINKI
jgi:hypothetical protein